MRKVGNLERWFAKSRWQDLEAACLHDIGDSGSSPSFFEAANEADLYEIAAAMAAPLKGIPTPCFIVVPYRRFGSFPVAPRQAPGNTLSPSVNSRHWHIPSLTSEQLTLLAQFVLDHLRASASTQQTGLGPSEMLDKKGVALELQKLTTSGTKIDPKLESQVTKLLAP